MSTSTPIFNENGEIIMVVTNTRDKDLVEKFMAALEVERLKTAKYKTALKYLSESKTDSKNPVAIDPRMNEILGTCRIIDRSDSTVLIQGESGTGKEVITRFIHNNSLRNKEILIPVNCSAIPQELLESEFFGYERGAFTGASLNGKPGFFEMADNGTLFLDEIAELPLSMQSKLLRVLETGEIQRLGGTKIYQSNVRIIAATNRNLKSLVDEKIFRGDLFYRLNVIPVYLPPLRERPADIPALANKFLEEFNRKYGLKKYLSQQSMDSLLSYSWPGNIRELRNVIERMVITTEIEELNFRASNDYPECPRREERPAGGSDIDFASGPLKEVLRNIETRYIQKVLEGCNGNVTHAADKLGIHRTMLHRKLKEINAPLRED